jgi:hypothetical protein
VPLVEQRRGVIVGLERIACGLNLDEGTQGLGADFVVLGCFDQLLDTASVIISENLA